MNDQFCFVPTGEVRLPKAGEWFGLDDGILQAMLDFTGGHNRPIYRRVPFAVVLWLVEACKDLLETSRALRGEFVCEGTISGKTLGPIFAADDAAQAALAAAREAGIGGDRG